MKILQVTNFFKPAWETGGVTRVAYDMSKYLHELGHSVTVYTTDGGNKRLKVTKNRVTYIDGIKTYYFKNVSQYLAKSFNFVTPYYLTLILKKEINKFDKKFHYETSESFKQCWSIIKEDLLKQIKQKGSEGK